MISNKFSLKDEAIAMQKIGGEFEKLSEESQIRVIQWLSSIANKGKALVQGDKQEEGKPQGVSDVKIFWQSKNPKNNYEKIAVLSYHFELNQKNGNFDLNDIRKLWDATTEVLPSKQVLLNAWRDVRAKYHYITTYSGTKKCRVAMRGQKLVETLPEAPKEFRGPTKCKKRKKVKKR